MAKEWHFPWKDLFQIIHSLDLDKETAMRIYEEARSEDFWSEYNKWAKKNKKVQRRIYECLSFSFFTEVLRFFNRK